jgi:undecaprenyl-phosphate galactose phosphotransferase
MKKKMLSLIVLITSDLATVVVSFGLAYLIRKEILPHIHHEFDKPLLPISVFLNYYYMLSIWLAVFLYEKLYTKRLPFWQEVKILIKSATLSSSFIMIMIFIARKQIEFSRTIVVLAWLLSLVLFPLSRFVVKIFLVKTNLWKKKLLIIGVQETSLLVLESITANKTMGYEVLGFLDEDPEKLGKKFKGVKVLGPLSRLEELTRAYEFKDIIITTPHLPRSKLEMLLSECMQYSDSMWLIPRSGDFITEGVEIEVMGEVLSLAIKKNLAKPWNILIKNIFELSLSVLLVILLFPLFVIIALAIKIDSKGPVFYVQERIGSGKSVFKMYKFRSMYLGNDKKLEQHLETNPQAREEWEKFKKLKHNDPRVTRVGKFLRRFSLDELPQLFNILQGKMSLVGPRPYLKKELEGKETFKDHITAVKPGITGLWQTKGRSELPFLKRISLDEYYIRNWSLWLDLTILMKSIKIWLSGKGAY